MSGSSVAPGEEDARVPTPGLKEGALNGRFGSGVAWVVPDREYKEDFQHGFFFSFRFIFFVSYSLSLSFCRILRFFRWFAVSVALWALVIVAEENLFSFV